MAKTSTDTSAPPEAVWSVLCDPAAYGEWVVGTKEVVGADPDWPAVGTQLEYRLGAGPVGVGDRTTVLASEAPRLLVLRAQLSRLGGATIRIELERVGEGTRIHMDEEPVDGVLGAVHNPVADAALGWRNDAALDRLKRLAEDRAGRA
jgi:uncharacterized protein YndB with AHSA1/START domain